MRAKIDRIGIEIEGEFTPDVHSKLQALGGAMKYDGSVNSCLSNTAYHKKHSHLRFGTGEYVTDPIEYKNKKHFKKVFDVLETAKKEGKFHWNKSAGFHIHISFKPKIPPEIRSTEFTKFALEKLQAEFPLEYRIRTEGRWCKVDRLDDDNFIREKYGDRYKAINYASFAKHGTLEFRIFPAKHPYKMYEYFRFTIKMVEEFLAIKTHSFKIETEIEEKDAMGLEINEVVLPTRTHILEIED